MKKALRDIDESCFMVYTELTLKVRTSAEYRSDVLLSAGKLPAGSVLVYEYPAGEAKLVDKFKKFRALLEEEQARMNHEYAQLEADSGGQERREGSPFGKREEEAAESAELEKRLALEKRIKHQLIQVERALDKIKEGNYGTCDRCGLPIGDGRLEALPWASLCMKCKALTANEPRGKLAGL